MGCANAFSGHRPHCSPLLVDAIRCSCKARQARASSKCSWPGGDTEHGVEDDSLQDGKSDDKDHDGNSDDNDVGDRW